MTDLDARAALAVDLAVRAGRLALAMRLNLAPVDAKTAIDFCTEADLAVEQMIRQEVAASFGGDSFIGEEYGGEPGDAVWVVDPIDGTAGYIHGTPRWCVSIAFVLAGVIEIGVIYAPVTDRLFIARRGRGAQMNGRPIQVSGLRHGAAPLGLAEVACGVADGYVELHMNAWDALAGVLLVQEAGGRINDILADDGLRRGNLVLASTPEIAEPLAAMTHDLFAAPDVTG